MADATVRPVLDAQQLIAIQSLVRRMPVPEQVLEAIIRLVREDDHGSVILQLGVVVERMHDSGEWCVDRSSGYVEQIEPDVDGAMLVGHAWSGSEQR